MHPLPPPYPSRGNAAPSPYRLGKALTKQSHNIKVVHFCFFRVALCASLLSSHTPFPKKKKKLTTPSFATWNSTGTNMRILCNQRKIKKKQQRNKRGTGSKKKKRQSERFFPSAAANSARNLPLKQLTHPQKPVIFSWR